MEPFILTHGLIQVANTKVFARVGNGSTVDLTQDTNTVYTHPTSQQCSSVNVSNATGTLPVNRGGTGVTTIAALKTQLGISTGGASQYEICPIGNLIKFDNKIWLCVHLDEATNRLYAASRNIISLTQFGSNTTYSGSTLAQVAANYQSQQMSSTALSYCANVTVNGVTSKVFVASYEQMNGGFSYFNSDASRIAYYNGSVQPYWTSSVNPSSSAAWHVSAYGDLSSDRAPGISFGFRPCLAIQL